MYQEMEFPEADIGLFVAKSAAKRHLFLAF